jgi:four helix bundle protein
MTKISSFEDLDCYKQAVELRRNLSVVVKSFPKDEKFQLVDQIKRASRSVTANIAEGYGRYHYQEYMQFCRQSRGSLYELIDHLNVSLDEGYITDLTLTELRGKTIRCISILNGFINYLERAKENKKNSETKEPVIEYGFTINH